MASASSGNALAFVCNLMAKGNKDAESAEHVGAGGRVSGA